MDKRLIKILEPSFMVYFLCLLLFAAVSSIFSIGLAVAELLACIVLFAYYKFSQYRTRRETGQYLETLIDHTQGSTRDVMMNFPMPVVIATIGVGRILWWNELFEDIMRTGDSVMEQRMTDFAHGFDANWLLEMDGAKGVYPTPVNVGGRVYEIYGSIVSQPDGTPSTLMTLYWHDCTEDQDCRRRLEEGNPVAAVISIDNYEELVKGITDSEKSKVLSQIDQKVNEWAGPMHGLLRKYDRDKYIFVLEEKEFSRLLEEKFSILEAMHEIASENGIGATLSIGIGRDGDSLEQKYEFAQLALEMALARGGDQAVIKNRYNFEFFGGKAGEVETRTKVKSRVKANALAELIKDSTGVLVMGHRFGDMDSVGGSVAVCSIARKYGVPAHIVADTEKTAAKSLIEKLKKTPEYVNAFISPQEAMLMADGKTLLVVVDTNRPEQVEDLALLQSCNKVAVIDHHRRAATYIERADMSYIEQYASSVCELMTEIMEVVMDEPDLLPCEAEAMLSGIVLDTKNFTMRTGERTFDAAAFLRRAGADTIEVKKLMQSGIEQTVAKYKILQNARTYRSVAIAMPESAQDRIVAAQAADELLNVAGVEASMVMYPDGDGVNVSARAIGDVNVQMIMEKLGGGGNRNAAAAQIKGVSLRDGVSMLIKAIDEYMDS